MQKLFKILKDLEKSRNNPLETKKVLASLEKEVERMKNETAINCVSLDAEQGVADAQYNLGAMYRYGRGVPQNYKTALKWYTLAAEQGNADAQYNLGQMYRKGQGHLFNTGNNKTALKWYTLAAEQGHTWAQREVEKLLYDFP